MDSQTLNEFLRSMTKEQLEELNQIPKYKRTNEDKEE